MTTPTTDTPSADAQAMEKVLLTENVADAIVLEKAHLSAAEDVASAAARELRYDLGKGSFVNRDTGLPLSVRDWLKGQRDKRPHWFKQSDSGSPGEPVSASKKAGFDPANTQPTPPGTAPASSAPVGRELRQMSEHEYAQYRRENRHARVLAAANVGGQRVFTVDCGSAATAQQVGAQSMDEYRRWRESQGLGRPVGGR